MNYEEALRYIHDAPRFKGKATLERMALLCGLLGDPQKKLRFVHVAGTNGKGSITNLIAAALSASGYRTGMFTSPYVVDFRERFQIDFRHIPRETFAAIARRVREADTRLAGQGHCATEFELVTACGLLYFYERRCQAVVLEVGLGGRFDATNCIPPPDCAVIGKIALDHTAILGGTLEQIAFEKCGIIKGGDVATYPQQDPRARAVIREQCALRGARLCAPRPVRLLESGLAHCRFLREGQEYFIPLGGAHQAFNAGAALDALDILRGQGYRLPPDAVRAGFARLRFPARLEQVGSHPRIFIDGAHNPDGMAALAAALEGTPFTAVFAAMKDKDYAGTASLIASRARRFIACGIRMERAAAPEEILAALPEGSGAFAAPDCLAALALARRGLDADECIVVCGSLYLACEARALLCPGGGEGVDGP